jgi:hypothetical protein
MCGPSQQEKDISASQQQMYQTLTQGYQTTFGQQQQITGALTQMFLPILQAGPSQAGFSSQYENALRTQADTGVATDYAQAQKATANILAARGGGNTLLPDSTAANILAGNANAAAQTRANQQLGITQANYAQGYQNWQAATSALSNTANLINPLGYAGQSTSAGQAASTTAQAMANQTNSVWNAAIGALGGIGGAALGNPTGLLSMFKGGGSTGTPGAYNSTTGLFNSYPYTGTVPFASGSGYTASNPLGM